MLKTKIEENKSYIYIALLLLLVVCPVFAYGFTFVIPFANAYALCSMIITPIGLFLLGNHAKEEGFMDHYKEEMRDMEAQLEEAWKEKEVLDATIKEYEGLFDSQMWEIPCNCEENTFIGLFSPSSENICECEKCKSRYRVTLNYESVQIPDGQSNEQIFHSLKTSLQSDQAV